MRLFNHIRDHRSVSPQQHHQHSEAGTSGTQFTFESGDSTIVDSLSNSFSSSMRLFRRHRDRAFSDSAASTESKRSQSPSPAAVRGTATGTSAVPASREKSSPSPISSTSPPLQSVPIVPNKTSGSSLQSPLSVEEDPSNKVIDYDDDAEEEEEEEGYYLDENNNNNGHPQLHRHLSPSDASTIIGGDKQSTQAPPSRKIFSFSMPFGSPATIGTRLQSLRARLKGEFEDSATLQRESIRNKLSRQDSITTVEEEILFKDVNKLPDVKISALVKAFIPKPTILSQSELKPPHLRIYEELSGDVIIVGGWRGSILRDVKTKRRVWIPVLKAGLNIKKIDLLLGPKDEDEINTTEKIYPDGILSHIGPVDISRKLMKLLESNPNITLHNFGYDWRLSLDISSKTLFKKLQDIYSKNGNKPIMIIAHSMGGIVSHSAMLQDPSLVRGIVYAGTPMPCPNVLGPLRYTDNILLSKDILTSEVNFMMRSSFIFVPRSGELFKDKKTGELINIDFFDPKNWVTYNLSPIVSSIRLRQERGEILTEQWQLNQPSKFAISFDEAYDYLSRTLKRTLKFMDSIKYDPNVKLPPLAIVFGNTVPSVRYSLVSGKKGIIEGDYYNFFYSPGDGVALHKYIFPEVLGLDDGVVVGKFNSSNGHVALLSDIESIGRALLSIVNEEEIRKNNQTTK